ncbi:hypothetical protein GGX14DRAFT_581427 [Mycena pura]|uniref:SAM domain-containing protein n=1 Tax=Mycena pura TaxID=153505 RepID=A0AAD6YUZ8_9AGAR|nr:hypothetical protein GGX14DRAFT_581427 [Mycena pura]
MRSGGRWVLGEGGVRQVEAEDLGLEAEGLRLAAEGLRLEADGLRLEASLKLEVKGLELKLATGRAGRATGQGVETWREETKRESYSVFGESAPRGKAQGRNEADEEQESSGFRLSSALLLHVLDALLLQTTRFLTAYSSCSSLSTLPACYFLEFSLHYSEAVYCAPNFASMAPAQDLDSGGEMDTDTDKTVVEHERDEEEDEEAHEEEEEEPPQKRKLAQSAESDDEEDAEPVKVPQKRKRAQSAESENHEPPPPRDIEYKICVYTSQQMKKSKSSRGAPATEIVTLKSDRSWSTLKSQIRSHISVALDQPFPELRHYNVSFTVPRQVSDPILLLNEIKYKYMVKKALSIQKSPNAKIVVEPKESKTEKENDDTMADSDSSKSKKKKKKTKIPNSRDILPANVALNEKIGELRERWQCPTPGSACGSEHCFYNEADPEHLPLLHAHMASKVFADVNTPPNNQMFDRVSTAARAAQSPLLQRRLELREQSAKNALTAPQVNINFPPEFLNLVRPAPGVQPTPAAPVGPNPSHSTTDMLIPFPRIVGDDLSINMFCLQYDLDFGIAELFDKNKFKRTSEFEFVGLNDLKEMGFARGEIAGLQVAIRKWSKLPGEVN